VEPPEFETVPEAYYRVMEGDTLVLPCKMKSHNELDDDQTYVRWEKVRHVILLYSTAYQET
jgi:hypothetical protein